MKDITLQGNWYIEAPLSEVFTMLTSFEKWPKFFPQVAESIEIRKRLGNSFEMHATVKSFGRAFPVKMNMTVLPQKGFISDNESPIFGTSGHEALFLSKSGTGTSIEYTYQVTIHKPWLRIIAKPLLGWFSTKFWERAVIDQLKRRLEK